jgi:hypothetical protein
MKGRVVTALNILVYELILLLSTLNWPELSSFKARLNDSIGCTDKQGNVLLWVNVIA